MMSKMRVCVVGAGVSGLVSAYILTKAGVEVVLYDHLGSQPKTFTVDGLDLDLSLMAFNQVTSPNMMELFETLGVDMKVSDMSFSVSLDEGNGYEWGNRNSLSSLFAQKTNVVNPFFLEMLRELTNFKDDALRYLKELDHNNDIGRNETLWDFITSHKYSELLQKSYLVPICSAFWMCPSEDVMRLSAYSVLLFFRNYHLFQLLGSPQWFTVRHGSSTYIKKVKEELQSRGCQIITGSAVQSVLKVDDGGILVVCGDGSQEKYSGCIMNADAPDTLKMLGEQATHEEKRILGDFNYIYSDIFLHHDEHLMPRNQSTWSALNFVGTNNNKVCLTYWLNVIQNINDNELPFLVTGNPFRTPKSILLKWSTGQPIPSVAASKASVELHKIQGKRGIWFCGSYQGYGFHEDELKAGVVAANSILNKSYEILNNPKPMVPSMIEAGARLLVVRFLRDYIATGTLVISEEGGTMFTFEGTRKKSPLKVCVKVHKPQFYLKVNGLLVKNDRVWVFIFMLNIYLTMYIFICQVVWHANIFVQIITKAGIGFGEAYVDGDFSFNDETNGLLNMIMIFVVNNVIKNRDSRSRKRGWWTPMFSTAIIGSAKYFLQHVLRQNSLAQARRNISRHYDMSNEVFSLFLDETMTYSCGLFKSEDEDLKAAQMRKINSLIEKARVDKRHEVLDIGCGWGSFAIEIVRQTGCKYTGITLSKEQIKYAERKVKEAGLQEKIRFLLSDYRQLPDTFKYDRIISCEAIEHVGHEYYEEFFGCCESVLVEDGVFVLQFISVPDASYDEMRLEPGFVREYIFPGGCLPSLSRLTSAMAVSSKLCVEHVEMIGIHYHQTLRCWRANLMKNQSKILALGFSHEFIRTLEFYFDSCAAGFMTEKLGDYQVVLSRPGIGATLTDHSEGVNSPY